MPTLHLRIAESGIYRALHGAFGALLLLSLILVCRRGYPATAAIGLVPLLACWLQLRHQPWSGAVIRCARGHWTLERGGEVIPVTPDGTSRLTPWVTFFCWRRQGRREQAWLFPDSAPPQLLRRLRARLTLESAVGRGQDSVPGLR